MRVDTSTSSQEEQEMDTSDDEERPLKEESEEGEEEENSRTEENDDALITEEKEEGDNTMDERIETGVETKPEDTEDMEGDNTMDDTNETEEAAGSVSEEINSVMPEMEPPVHMESEVINEQVEAGDIDCTPVETENLVESKQTTEDDQVAVCDTVS